MNIVYKETKQAKLTIASDGRVEVKIPTSMRGSEDDIVRLARLIVGEVGIPGRTLRGRLGTPQPGVISVTMYYDSTRELWGTRHVTVVTP